METIHTDVKTVKENDLAILISQVGLTFSSVSSATFFLSELVLFLSFGSFRVSGFMSFFFPPSVLSS